MRKVLAGIGSGQAWGCLLRLDIDLVKWDFVTSSPGDREYAG
jgi:hypothetical protein